MLDGIPICGTVFGVLGYLRIYWMVSRRLNDVFDLELL